MAIIKTRHYHTDLGIEQDYPLEPPQYERRVIWNEKGDICYYEHSPFCGGMPKIIMIEVAEEVFKVTPWMLFDDAIERLRNYIRVSPKRKHWQVSIAFMIKENTTAYHNTEVEYGLLDLKEDKKWKEYQLIVAIRDPNIYIPPEEKKFIPVTSIKGQRLNGRYWQKARLAMAVAFFGINFHYHIGKLDF